MRYEIKIQLDAAASDAEAVRDAARGAFDEAVRRLSRKASGMRYAVGLRERARPRARGRRST